MKKILFICFLALMTGYSGAQAEVALDKRRLDGIYAGAFDTDISEEIIAQNGALSTQKNIGVISSLSGASRNNDINNANRATLRSDAGSSAAAQANIGAIRLGAGAARNNDIRNTNTATLRNRPAAAPEPSIGTDVALNAEDSFISGSLSAASSAASAQSNIGVVVSETGKLSNTDIINRNSAVVRNRGDSALAMQINTGVIAHLGAENADNNDIRNTNTANVDNTAAGDEGFAEIVMGQGEEIGGNFASGELSSERSAAAAQTNIGAVIALGALRNSDINNRNRATVGNDGDSALAIQQNIGVVMAMGEGENNNNDINNRNNAGINNRVTDGNGSIRGVTNADADSLVVADIVIYGRRSAAAGQSNIGSIIAVGTLRNSDIINNNRASIRNRGDSALAMQSNIGAIACLGGGANRNNDIRNTNTAVVNNRVTDTTGGIEASISADTLTDTAMNTLFSEVTSMQSALAIQNNIAAIVAAGDITASAVRNRNTGRVANTADF